MAKKINHINYATAGKIYCRSRDKVVDLDVEQMRDYCSECPFFNGTAQGQGVECLWEDVREGVQNPHIVTRGNIERQWVITAEAKHKRGDE